MSVVSVFLILLHYFTLYAGECLCQSNGQKEFTSKLVNYGVLTLIDVQTHECVFPATRNAAE